MFLGLIPTFVEVTGKAPTFVEVREEKLVGGSFCPPPPILNRVKHGTIQKVCHLHNIIFHLIQLCHTLLI